MFRKAKNIDVAFRQMRLVAIIAILGSVFFGIWMAYLSYQQREKSDGRIFLLSNQHIYEATSTDQDGQDVLEIEAGSHVESFHRYFFTLNPNAKYIEKTINSALDLADRSAKQQYDILREKNYFDGIVSGNVTQTIAFDSIYVDLSKKPFHFRCIARQDITRPSTEVVRLLITEGYLRRIGRSKENPHGFLIERWKILENKDISIKKRL
ncbi:MAG: conjugative transposon protein TraK [Candidatus Pseudobacter hemicellulosilyticus]|uniref:Conjugative transposon protein TraK n=1 Tax=Candidatus Pseudobacter hemicellulosilyticus TaxID=3121375 RepID=A0AAJ5WSS1_9BACT|nr:MAG: conjugative transposon protein TraK [Pseudobacter sp.]